MEGKRLLGVTPHGEINVVAETDRGPNGLAVGPDNAFYLTNNGSSFQFFVRDGINMHGPTAPHHTGGAIQRIDLATVATTAVYIRCGERQLLALRLDASGEVQFIEGIIGSPPVSRLTAATC
jgi:gluconolactonase